MKCWVLICVSQDRKLHAFYLCMLFLFKDRYFYLDVHDEQCRVSFGLWDRDVFFVDMVFHNAYLCFLIVSCY